MVQMQSQKQRNSWQDIRLLSKPSRRGKLRGDSERRTGVSTQVHEDSSTESTKQVASAAGFGKRSIDGILLLDKPIDVSSNLILQRVRRLYQAKKAGHTGSLDPLATGMLPICFGEAAKFSQFLLDADKCYVVVGKFGVTTNSADSQGEIVKMVTGFNISRAQLTDAVSNFVGEIWQVPPMYSALKYKGQPLYKYARAGIEIERKPRKVNIYASEILEQNSDTFKLRVRCSKGTYIRTLIEDIGAWLGVGAHVTMLHREYVAGFINDRMHSFASLEDLSAHKLEDFLLPVDRTVQHLADFSVSTAQADDLFHGKVIVHAGLTMPVGSLLRLYDSASSFIGLGEVIEGKGLQGKRLINSLKR